MGFGETVSKICIQRVGTIPSCRLKVRSWYFPIFGDAALGEYTIFLGMYQDTYDLPTVNRRLLDYRVRKVRVVKGSQESVEEKPSLNIKVAGIRSEEEYFEILRDRIIWCICHNLLSNNIRTFHGADMIIECAKGFLDERRIAQYKLTGEHEYYTNVLEKIYKPLIDGEFIEEYENNNYRIPEGSKLENICRTQLSDGRSYMRWNEIDWG